VSTNGKTPRDPLDSVDDAIAKLEGTEWEDDEPITGQHLVEAMKAGAAIATGKHRALGPDEPTPTEPRGKPISVAPKSGIPGLIGAVSGGAARIVSAVNNVYALLGLALLVAAFIAWLRLRP